MHLWSSIIIETSIYPPKKIRKREKYNKRKFKYRHLSVS